MSEHERALLTVMAQVGRPIGWYVLERKLSALRVPDRPFIGGVLDELLRRGLIAEWPKDAELKTRYELTAKGIEELGGG